MAVQAEQWTAAAVHLCSGISAETTIQLRGYARSNCDLNTSYLAGLVTVLQRF